MREILVTILAVAIGTGGCSEHGHGGKVVAEYPVEQGGHRRRPLPTLGWTSAPGVYVLFARQETAGWDDAKKVRGGWELGAWRLPKRSRLGFMAAAGDGVVAIAGGDETTLPAGRYCWHVKQGSTPIDWGATALVGVLIVAAAVGVYAAWWSSEFELFDGGNTWFAP
jgi:hypothetical protein